MGEFFHAARPATGSLADEARRIPPPDRRTEIKAVCDRYVRLTRAFDESLEQYDSTSSGGMSKCESAEHPADGSRDPSVADEQLETARRC
jgi:hypothetical protein